MICPILRDGIIIHSLLKNLLKKTANSQTSLVDQRQ